MTIEDHIDAARSSIAQLRESDTEGSLLEHEFPVPGIWFDMDAEQVDLDARYKSSVGMLFDAKINVRNPGRWLSFIITLGNAPLSGFSVLGFTCESSAPQAVSCQVSVRTGQRESFQDAFFEKQFVSYDTPSFHVDALQIAKHPELQVEASWRNLMFHFQPRSFDLALQDFRIFLA